jgi:hypothetical protein
MKEAAANLEFEIAAVLRDQLNDLRAVDAPMSSAPASPDGPRRGCGGQAAARRRRA